MWFATQSVVLTSGAAEGGTDLNAFDNALRAGGIADFNLIKVTSIIPPAVPVYTLPKARDLIVGDGLMVPTIYGTLASNQPGARLATAVGAGLPTESARAGVVFVHSCEGDKTLVESVVRAMVKEGMEAKGIHSYRTCIASAATKTDSTEGTWACVVAAALFCDSDVFATFRDTKMRRSHGHVT